MIRDDDHAAVALDHHFDEGIVGLFGKKLVVSDVELRVRQVFLAVSLKKDVDELVHAAFAVTCDAGTERLFAEAVSYFASDRPNKTAKIKCLFYRMIVTVTDILSTPGHLSPSAKRLLPAMARIKTGFADPALRIDELARLARLSKKHFTGEFVSVYGDTPGQYILSLRIDMACRLLTRTGLPVRVIAKRCGFGSEYYFSRIFSVKTGYPPTVYRKNFRNV